MLITDWFVGCDAMAADDDDVIKIASATGGGGGGGGLEGSVRGQELDGSPPGRTDHVPLTDWTAGRVTASAPLLPADVVVCLGACRHGSYQTTATTTTTSRTSVAPPPSYSDSIHRCTSLRHTCRPTYYHRHYPDTTSNQLHAAQLNYYTNRT